MCRRWTVTLLVVISVLYFVGPGISQTKTPSTIGQLSLNNAQPLKAFLQTQYLVQLKVRGGSPPFTWKLTNGSLPKGISLERNGVLSGTPTEAGDFHFVVTITDSTSPALQRNQDIVLRVLAPLLVQWESPAKVNGQRIEGSIKVSNQTERDYDLTAIILAVNEIGRATAIGYQHFALKQNTIELEIPFGENLPTGAYQVTVDVVAEIAATNAIYRARLVTPGKLQIVQAP